MHVAQVREQAAQQILSDHDLEAAAAGVAAATRKKAEPAADLEGDAVARPEEVDANRRERPHPPPHHPFIYYRYNTKCGPGPSYLDVPKIGLRCDIHLHRRTLQGKAYRQRG